MKMHRFPSIAALAEACADRFMSGFPLDACGGETIADVRRYAQSGNDALVAQAETMIDRFSAELNTDRAVWFPDICGAYPMVAEFLAGAPECMRRRQMVASEIAPLAIYVGLGASWQLTPETIMRRGTAILAFVMAMARVRPISLHVYFAGAKRAGAYDRVDGTESVFVAPVNTAPLDVASAAYVLTSAGFFRRAMMALGHQDQGADWISWPLEWKNDKPAYNRKLVAEHGDDPENALVIDGAISTDPLISEPEAWLAAQLARFAGREE